MQTRKGNTLRTWVRTYLGAKEYCLQVVDASNNVVYCHACDSLLEHEYNIKVAMYY